MIYLVSDTHFYHYKIIEYCNRPFHSVEQMNKFMTRMWNSVVEEDDTVYFLGDLALTCTKDQVKDILSSLKGRKILIKGNHDKYSNDFYLESGFIEVHKSYLLPYKEINFVLTHIPEHPNWHSRNNNWKPIKVSRSVVNIHGHLHNTKSEYLPEWGYFNVGVENIDYTPISIEDIYSYISKATVKPSEVRAGIGRVLTYEEKESLVIFSRFSQSEREEFDKARLEAALKTLDLLKEILISEPSLRLGQLWTNIFSNLENDIFYLENNESLRIVEEYGDSRK